MIAETVIIHGGDLIEWHEAGAFIGRPPCRIPSGRLNIEFKKASPSLRIVHKTNGMLLWSRNSSAASLVVNGEATAEDMKRASAATYPIIGSVSDSSGCYLPRIFTLMLGGSSQHVIQLHRSPVGARFTNAGGIFGQVVFDDGTVAPWALIYLTLTPPLTTPISFVAQADNNGEFRLPLDRMPAQQQKHASTTEYSAKLTVKAVRTEHPEHPVDPDTLTAVKVAKGVTVSGKSQFADTLNLAITTGKIANIVSPRHQRIVIKSN